MLGDFTALLRAFVAATVVDGLECYPIFLPPRSMVQVEFVETLERFAGCWRIGTQPHSRALARARRGNNNTPNGKLAIEAPPERTSSPLAPSSPSSPAPRQSASPPSAWDIVRPAFAIDVFICLTSCSGSGTPPHTHRRPLPYLRFTAISTLASHSIARVSSSHPSRRASGRAQNRMRSRSGSSRLRCRQPLPRLPLFRMR